MFSQASLLPRENAKGQTATSAASKITAVEVFGISKTIQHAQAWPTVCHSALARFFAQCYRERCLRFASMQTSRANHQAGGIHKFEHVGQTLSEVADNCEEGPAFAENNF
eukprot:757521-Amphidinium_carterae.4